MWYVGTGCLWSKLFCCQGSFDPIVCGYWLLVFPVCLCEQADHAGHEAAPPRNHCCHTGEVPLQPEWGEFVGQGAVGRYLCVPLWLILCPPVTESVSLPHPRWLILCPPPVTDSVSPCDWFCVLLWLNLCLPPVTDSVFPPSPPLTDSVSPCDWFYVSPLVTDSVSLQWLILEVLCPTSDCFNVSHLWLILCVPPTPSPSPLPPWLISVVHLWLILYPTCDWFVVSSLWLIQCLSPDETVPPAAWPVWLVLRRGVEGRGREQSEDRAYPFCTCDARNHLTSALPLVFIAPETARHQLHIFTQ